MDLIFLGDIHGNFKWLQYAIQKKQLQNCTIIQVGDFGIGSLPKTDEAILIELNEFLSKQGVILYAIRGNHDDPKFFKGNHIQSHLKLVPDYTQLEIEGNNILFVGGAISIDRKYKIARMQHSASYGIDAPCYWFDEAFSLDEEKIKNIKGVDVVVTHTTPDWCYPDNKNGFGEFVNSFIYSDPDLERDLLDERQSLSRMFNILMDNGNKIKKHYYGHFHKNIITRYGDCEHILLGINELKLHI